MTDLFNAPAPIRMRLSRAKGFDLQAASIAANGLKAIVVARPTRWGNPFDFRRSEYCWAALSWGCRGDRIGRQEASVKAFREWIEPPNGKRTLLLERQPKLACRSDETKEVNLGPKIEAGEAPPLDELRAALRGKNLACWCKIGEPCHADVLLELANKEP